MIRLLAGDCREVLATLPAESVHTVVTSPPYYGLRDYGTALWDGGDAQCDHSVPLGDGSKHQTDDHDIAFRTGANYVHQKVAGRVCRCGAVRVDRQIGLEPTPDEYLATMVGVFRQIRRVMRKDAVAFINMGDSYADKQLQMIPARLAIALQADGWVLRSDIIWHKPNPMPESCRDRPTSAHEHVFLLTRSSRYYFDADAVREAHADWRDGGNTSEPKMQAGERIKKVWNPGRNEYNPAGRSCRNVWTIATAPYKEAHFATFPPELAERCIRAGTSERGCCAVCGKPWGRITDKTFVPQGDVSLERGIKGAVGQKPMYHSDWDGVPRGSTIATTTGWSPGCQCDAGVAPCVVLDPFIGAGTTALVADRLQRDCIGIDLNTQYTRMAMDRCIADAPLLTSFAPAEDPEDERMADLFTDMAAD